MMFWLKVDRRFDGLRDDPRFKDLVHRVGMPDCVHLKDSRGRIVVLNFWATWCGPCSEEMPMLVEAEREYRAEMVPVAAMPTGLAFVRCLSHQNGNRRVIYSGMKGGSQNFNRTRSTPAR